METMKSFAARVELATGICLEEIPVVTPGDSRLPLGAIFARRGNEFVVATGYPNVSEDGEETWPPESFRRYVISGSGSGRARCAHWVTARAVTQGSGGRRAHRMQRCTRWAKAGSECCQRHTR